jgi:acyl carrier protein
MRREDNLEGAMPPSREAREAADDLTRRVERLVQARAGLPPEAIGPQLVLADLELDSVALLELLLECESLAGRPLPARLLEGGALTLGQLLAALGAQAGGQ